MNEGNAERSMASLWFISTFNALDVALQNKYN
jgi:hypothetical protein